MSIAVLYVSLHLSCSVHDGGGDDGRWLPRIQCWAVKWVVPDLSNANKIEIPILALVEEFSFSENKNKQRTGNIEEMFHISIISYLHLSSSCHHFSS